MYQNFIKRIIDILVSVIGVIIFLIFLIPVSILIKLEDQGPVFFNRRL